MKFKSELQLEALNNATVDTDKFLVSDSTTVKYRTGAQLLSDLGVSGLFVPYTGATGNVDLGTHTLLAKDLIINHSSGSGVAASITKNGSGEALTVIKGSGSGNAMSVTGGLTSLVDLSLSTVANATGDFLTHSGSTIHKRTPSQVLSDIGGQAALTNPITGTGTTNYVSKFTGTTTLGNSLIYDNGTNVGIGTTSPAVRLDFGNSVNQAFHLYTSGADYYGLNMAQYDGGNFSTNIFSGDGGLIKFRTASGTTTQSTRMTITSGGNVGIGTTSPNTLLHLYKTSFPVLTIDSGIVSANIGIDTSDLLLNIGTDTNHSFKFTTNSSERMRITSAGNVGIGTTNPTSSNWARTLQLEGASAGFKIASSSANGEFWAAGDVGINVNTAGKNLYLGNASSLTAFTLASSGNVGIGTTSPTQKLDVRGNIYTNGTNTNLYLDNGGPGGASLQIGVTGSTSTYINSVDAHPLLLLTSNVERMRITSAGNVGIGTTSPGGLGEKLTVIGSINSNNTALFFGDGADNSASIYSTAGPIKFLANASERMRITSAGNVGIGTTSPTEKLSIVGNVTAVNYFIENSVGTGGTFRLDGYQDYLYIYGDTSNIAGYRFGSDPAGIVMQIGTNGNVGIGTTNPQTTLEVLGANEGEYLRAGAGTITDRSLRFSNFTVSGLTGVGHRLNAPNANANLALAVGGTDRLYINSSGNVGIGTTSPIRPLDVSADSGANAINIRTRSANDYGILSFSNSTASEIISELYIHRTGTNIGSLIFSTNNGSSPLERMRITSTGNVGIGTTSPSSKLTVDAGDVTLTNGNLYVAIGSGNNYSSRLSTALNYPNVDTYLDSIGGGGWEGRLNFRTSSNGGSLTTKMTITDSGSVGIGTSSPQTLLQLGEGSLSNATTNQYLRVNAGGYNALSYAHLDLFNFGNNFGNSLGWRLTSGTEGAGVSVGRYLSFNTVVTDGSGNPSTSSERMRITSVGNVLIGTTTDLGSNLNVNSNIRVGVTFGNEAALILGDAGTAYWKIARPAGSGNLRISSYALNAIEVQPDTGNVGIGTTSPTQKLDVAGTIRAFGAGNAGRITSVDTQVGGASIAFNPQFSTGIPGIETIGAFPMVFYTNSSEKMRISSSGNVGIGTASPNASAILHLRSTTQGFLPPVMRTGERNDISSPAVGLMIFNEEEDAVQVFTSGEGWRTLAWA